MRRSKLLLLLLLLLLTGCSSGNAHGAADLRPTLCHRESLVGLLFVTVENRGADAGATLLSVSYQVTSANNRQVRLEVQTPPLPAGAETWIAVQVPPLPHGGYQMPDALVIITADAGNALRENHHDTTVLMTSCQDPR
jgi:hypothetical protein